MAIAYAEHPISKAQKAALRKEGFDKVLDIRFAPEQLENGDKRFPKKKKEKEVEVKIASEFVPGSQVDLDTGRPVQ